MCSECAMSNSQVKLGVLGTEEDRLNRASCEDSAEIVLEAGGKKW